MSEIGETFSDLKELRRNHKACKPRCVECGAQLSLARFSEGRTLCGSCTLRETIRKQEKEIAELRELERQYATSLGRLAQLCDTVIPWALDQDKLVAVSKVVPASVITAAEEIMQYVDSVRLC